MKDDLSSVLFTIDVIMNMPINCDGFGRPVKYYDRSSDKYSIAVVWNTLFGLWTHSSRFNDAEFLECRELFDFTDYMPDWSNYNVFE